jgi:hypothetical protein
VLSAFFSVFRNFAPGMAFLIVWTNDFIRPWAQNCVVSPPETANTLRG